MSNCNDLFQTFLSRICLTIEQRSNLQIGRDAIKQKIENYFSNDLKVTNPEFLLQGSYALKTMVKPLGLEDYDLDDGVYLQHTDDDISKPTPSVASNWIIEAVKNHTKKAPKNKKNCVRVVYAENYHIDLPIYRTIRGDIYLGTLEGNEWIPSDAKKFNKHFRDMLVKNEQMRSCIKYLKAWKDFEGCDLKGIHITALVGLKHIAAEDRDDESLTNTVSEIVEYLEGNRDIYNPIDQEENFIEDWSDSKIDKTITTLKNLQENAAEAIDEEDKQESSKLWRKVFGNRFPEYSGTKIKSVVVGPSHREFEPGTKPWSRC